MSSNLKRSQKRVVNQALNRKVAGTSLGKDRTTIEAATGALEGVGYGENEVTRIMRKAGITLGERSVKRPRIEPNADEFDWSYIDAIARPYRLLPEDEISATLTALDDEQPGTLEYAYTPDFVQHRKVQHLVALDQPMVQPALVTWTAQCLACGNTNADCVLTTRVTNTGLGLCTTCVATEGVRAKWSNLIPVS